MSNVIRRFFSGLPFGVRLLALGYLVLGAVALTGVYTQTFDLYAWLGLSPARVWRGEVWRLVTYGFLPAGILDWVISGFWLATLIAVLGRNWTARGFWGYCLLGIIAGAIPFVLLKREMEGGIATSAGMMFALLVAWDWFYRRERLILLGVGEISVRQAAILIAIIDSLILFFWCGGWIVMPAMWCGGVAGWVWLTLRTKLFMGKTPQQIRSERVARLEL